MFGLSMLAKGPKKADIVKAYQKLVNYKALAAIRALSGLSWWADQVFFYLPSVPCETKIELSPSTTQSFPPSRTCVEVDEEAFILNMLRSDDPFPIFEDILKGVHVSERVFTEKHLRNGDDGDDPALQRRRLRHLSNLHVRGTSLTLDEAYEPGNKMLILLLVNLP